MAFTDFRKDPEKYRSRLHPGKIEIFSRAAPRPEQSVKEIPAIPKYIQEWESPFGPEAKKHPLQVVGHHSLARIHSTMSGVDWLEEAFPQRVFVNPIDAVGARDPELGDGHGFSTTEAK